MEERRPNFGVAAGGALVAILVSMLLVFVRGEIDSTNVALILVVVIVAAASFGGRIAGALTSLAAALSFNFFFVEPYLTLRIHNAQDVWTVLLLFVVGITVGELALLRRSSRTDAGRQLAGARHLEDVTERLAEGRNAEGLWPELRAALIEQLGLAEVRFEPHRTDRVYDVDLPEIGRSGSITAPVMHWTPQGMELPRDGAQVAVRAAGRVFGRIVLVPTPGRGTSIDERRVAVALVDSYAIALDRDMIRARLPADVGNGHSATR
jgi:K+-sensing histidine kinase KdpD